MRAALRLALSDLYYHSIRLVPANLVWGIATLAVGWVAVAVSPALALLIAPLVAFPLLAVARLAGLIVRGHDVVLSDAWDVVRRRPGRTLVAGIATEATIVVLVANAVIGLTTGTPLGLGLAILASLRLPGRRFFRVVFLLPMMITPVGVAYLFQMLTDTGKGPFLPVFQAFGLGNFTWTTDPWLARTAVMIGDIWQWTPFLFIVLLAALEGQDQEVLEAAHVDGASRWQAFRHITIPAILPVSTTVILIRMIEAFKIVDLPNILTNGGPGTATESITLQAFFDWRTQSLGRSAALAYTLLILVTVVATAYVNLVRRRVAVS